MMRKEISRAFTDGFSPNLRSSCYVPGSVPDEHTEAALPAEHRLGMNTQRANVGPGARVGVQCPVTHWRQHGRLDETDGWPKGIQRPENPVPCLQSLIS